MVCKTEDLKAGKPLLPKCLPNIPFAGECCQTEPEIDPMAKVEKLKFCRGCHSDFYNGYNDMGIKECWNFRGAKLVKRVKVSFSQVPPWTQKPIKVLNCCHYDGYVMVEPNDPSCKRRKGKEKEGDKNE